MALQAGIVGLPNVGKSTLFNAVSNSAKAQASNIGIDFAYHNEGDSMIFTLAKQK